MLFGHNSNVEAGGQKFHVQTEDRGVSVAIVSTTVHIRGRVCHKVTTNYADLLPLDPAREEELKKRLDEQHRGVIEAIRSGEIRVEEPAPAPPPGVLKLEVMNAKDWLAAKRATLQISVRDVEGNAISDAQVVVRVHGSEPEARFAMASNAYGQAQFEFDMPKISGADPALLIEASEGNSRGQLRFQLKAKPRVPAASEGA